MQFCAKGLGGTLALGASALRGSDRVLPIPLNPTEPGFFASRPPCAVSCSCCQNPRQGIERRLKTTQVQWLLTQSQVRQAGFQKGTPGRLGAKVKKASELQDAFSGNGQPNSLEVHARRRTWTYPCMCQARQASRQTK